MSFGLKTKVLDTEFTLWTCWNPPRKFPFFLTSNERSRISLSALTILEFQDNLYLDKFTVIYCESVNLIGYITVVCLLTDNSCTRDCTRDCTCDPFSTFAPDVT